MNKLEYQLKMALADAMDRAQQKGLPELVKRYFELDAANNKHGPEFAILLSHEWPEYKTLRAAQARDYVKTFMSESTASIALLQKLLLDQGSKRKALPQLKADFNQICSNMEKYQVYIHDQDSFGFAVEGPRIEVEAELCMELLLRVQARMANMYWSQPREKIEQSMRIWGVQNGYIESHFHGARLSDLPEAGLN